MMQARPLTSALDAGAAAPQNLPVRQGRDGQHVETHARFVAPIPTG
ncbi:MAG: hypothetical protein IPK17_21705 [Chloroflexi bacterium]|nr:hypothetical protein [Chloroflexota bacterium]